MKQYITIIILIFSSFSISSNLSYYARQFYSQCDQYHGTYSFYPRQVDWKKVRMKSHQPGAGARSYSETLPALQFRYLYVKMVKVY